MPGHFAARGLLDAEHIFRRAFAHPVQPGPDVLLFNPQADRKGRLPPGDLDGSL